jgi:hypothetical protein
MSSEEQLRHIADELRATFAAERDAIARLDVTALARIGDAKQALADQLAAAVAAVRADGARDTSEVRAIVSAVQVEARATALLAGAAAGGVRALLGTDANGGYDRRAKHVTMGTTRNLGRL